MKLDVRNMSGAVVEDIEVLDDLFDVPMNAALVHQVMVGQLANKRQGTAKVKTRSEVAGGGAKPRPQKYTGRARQGSIRSPIWRGGGVVFGPTPRSYRQRTPKRVKRQALKMVLSDKAREQQLIVVDELSIAAAKTKELAQALNALGVDSSVLLVSDGTNDAVVRAARNIPKTRTLPVDLLNTVDLLNAKSVVISVDAVREAERLWGGDLVRIKQATAGAEEEA
ncbi:MAG: 50S ribosomal protein L4 [Chloroflexi bacterium]|nr:50S ribosomal protein L4 [Chloroflexota bacterium]MCY3638848.1 50S ribosomal protein L4 [Chloroflexota bacterium]